MIILTSNLLINDNDNAYNHSYSVNEIGHYDDE